MKMWLLSQFEHFNVLTIIVMITFVTTMSRANTTKLLKEQSQEIYAEFEELKSIKQFLSGHTLILSDDKDNADLSLRCTALKHGDFDNDVPTLTSILNSL
jgi:hypothetical protein